MKLITRDTDYALRALCYIAKGKKKIVSVSELAEELKIPRPFLRKLLQVLNKKRILKSYKGKGGGFSLEASADKIFLVDLIKIFQGVFELNECLSKKKLCSQIGSCVLRKELNSIENNVFAQLKPISIASLLTKESG